MLAYGDTGLTPRQGMAHFATGLGLVEGLVLDQHFSQRARLGRLLTAVANNPHLLGVGIDENTAVLIENNQLQVVGEQGVMLLDGRASLSNAAERDHGQIISLSNICLHHLTAGDTFDLTTRRWLAPASRRA